MAFLCYKWGGCSVKWNLTNWTWSECQLIEEIISGGNQPGVDASQLMPSWIIDSKTQTEKEKRKRFIRLLCKIKGITAYDEEKLINEKITITVEDIKIVIKAVSGIDLNIKE